ncbi:hypothetical protein [Embleya sp. NPDC050493]|uniref:hypothetical protein n=1 Tax=Embleya sp. NPDC050493 TaxID=3363989 RepID=UPI0037B9B335
MIEEIIALGSARSLATDCSLPAEGGSRLAEHPEPAVRCAIAAGVADHPPGLSARLAGDSDPSVRMFLAMNDHLPSESQAWRDGPADSRQPTADRRASATGEVLTKACPAARMPADRPTGNARPRRRIPPVRSDAGVDPLPVPTACGNGILVWLDSG